MTKKEAFINDIVRVLEDTPEKYLSPDALDYWNGLNVSGKSEGSTFTSNGRMILRYMQETKEQYNNLFKAKEIGEGLNISSRTASGGMRKLVTDGYIEKIGENPSVYAITDKGLAANLNSEES